MTMKTTTTRQRMRALCLQLTTMPPRSLTRGATMTSAPARLAGGAGESSDMNVDAGTFVLAARMANSSNSPSGAQNHEHLKRIYNFLCSMLILYQLLHVLYTLYHFYAFSRTNLLTRSRSASSLFSAVFCFRKPLKEIFSELDDSYAKVPIFSDAFQKSEDETKEGTEAPS